MLPNKQMKSGGKNNSCVTKEWKLFCLRCDAKTANIALSYSKYIKAEWRRTEDCAISVIGLNGPTVVDKVECSKSQWLAALINVYKETVHKVGAGTDGLHA